MVYSTTDWFGVEEECLSDELLIETFIKDIHKTIYVLQEGKVTGIISHGDFCRYITEERPLIQRTFMRCTLQNEADAKEILQEKVNIYSVPVLDKEGHMIREWRKEVLEEENYFSNRMMFMLYKQFLSDRDGYFNILVMDLSGKEDAETAKEINEKAVGKLLVIDKKDVLNINKCCEGIKPGIVYDYRIKYMTFMNIVYNKLGVQSSFLKKASATENVIDHVLEFYGSVGILDSEAGELSDEYKQIQAVCIFDDNQFAWNEVGNCFEYKGCIESEEVPEVLWVSCCLLKNPYFKYRDKVIPVESGEFSIYEKYVYAAIKSIRNKVSDYDIAYNIIPKLNENKINYVILSNNDNEYKQIKEYDIKEAEKRVSNVLKTYINSRPNQFFNLDGCVSADEFYMEQNNAFQGWDKRGYYEFKDYKGKYVNISRGERLVLGNPKSYNHILWLFGPCLIRGGYVDDASSLGSVLRKKMDDSYYIKNMGATFQTQNLCIRDAVLSKGDIIVVQAYDNSVYEKAGLEVDSLLDVFNQCQDLMEHIVDIPNHADAYLTEKVAERLYEILISRHMLNGGEEEKKNAEENSTRMQIRMRTERDNCDVPQGLKRWLSDIQAYKGAPFFRTGAIVMNCNPFTLGHRYLVERACEQVDKLLIFVVEEDKSFFKFEDRLEMVRLGTKDLGKVSVIPSGRYIISSETLPGYFEKDENPEIIIDATDDLDLFAKVIAKELNISVRFAGEEPIDGYTRQYNQAMSKVLPQNYIEFVEIPRKEQDGSVISASRVRKLLKEKRYADMEKLVLPQIYEYLHKYMLV